MACIACGICRRVHNRYVYGIFNVKTQNTQSSLRYSYYDGSLFDKLRNSRKSVGFLSMDTTTIFSQTAFLFGNGHFALYSKFVVILVITLIAKFALDWYMRTKSGFLLRSVGDNEGLVITLLHKIRERLKLSVLRLQTDLFRLQVRCTANTAKRLTLRLVRVLLLWVLPPLLSAPTIFKKIKFLRITTGVLFGMIIYKACISIAHLPQACVHRIQTL